MNELNRADCVSIIHITRIKYYKNNTSWKISFETKGQHEEIAQSVQHFYFTARKVLMCTRLVFNTLYPLDSTNKKN